MTGVSDSSSEVRGARVVRALLIAVLATVVLPPAGAWWLNARRVATTTDRVAAGTAGPNVANQVLCGPGQFPEAGGTEAQAIHAEWLSRVVVDTAGAAAGRQADAWGHCLLVSEHWILSAGTNGVIETPLDSTRLNGDDIGIRVK